MTNLSSKQTTKLNELGIQTTTKSNVNLIPLLSISGLTIISFGGLLLLKNKSDPPSSYIPSTNPQINDPKPTQVPKSIQHYLLTSQQYFVEAINRQKSENITPLVNEAITTISEAIQLFPSDYRGWEQRGRIYQSLTPSQPQFLPIAIIDFKQATSLNPTNTDNLFSLAHLQEQAGELPDGLVTYYRLLSLVSNKNQHEQVITEIQSIRRLLSQNTTQAKPSTTPIITPILEGNLIQASTNNNLVIAAPENTTPNTATTFTQSNSLSGNAVLPSNQNTITLTNSLLKSTSQVYLTILKGGKNQNLQVLSRSKDTFTVGLDSATTEDIQFKWWIVN
ncbi:hypothetical protein KBC75_05925 [Candidatus Shapirobacteria bacterium]|nr:hypothetical protein [Candidatus Shapirobacteria bacterium]